MRMRKSVILIIYYNLLELKLRQLYKEPSLVSFWKAVTWDQQKILIAESFSIVISYALF